MADRRFRLLLIDEDAVFRLGLRVWLERYPELQIEAEAADGEEALQYLVNQATGAVPAIDLVILDIGLGRTQPTRPQGLTLCQQIKTLYPQLPVLFLGATAEPVLVAAAQQVGATGYCAKSLSAGELVTAIRQVARGRSRFVEAGAEPQSRRSVLALSADSADSILRRPAVSVRQRSFIRQFRSSLRNSGIQQIDAALSQVNAELQRLELSLLDRALLAGQQRELRASRRLVIWLLAERQPSESQPSEPQPLKESPPTPISSPPQLTAPAPSASALVPSSSLSSSPTDTRTLQSVLFDSVLAKLQTNLENETETPMETDILREDKKRELFYLVLHKLEDLLSELRYSEVQPAQLAQKRSLILVDLWQAIVVDFFGKYYTISFKGAEVEVVNTLLADTAIVQLAILDRIPGVVELLNHLLFQTPLVVDSVAYASGNPEALARAELLTENLLIQLANAVIQPLLNRFANVELIKEAFYHRRLLSSREIERFRNNLSWKYRVERYFHNPQAIFESQYRLFVFSWKGIKRTAIYAPRNQELEQLSGIPFAVTLALETRDAIAPRLRSVISLVGNSVIYVLTEVVGRGIGLVGRGILKGLGNALQERR
ncbi:DUF3685 domain-containing protein [Phormidium tenue FACHB-886]|nr:DUF3685 domain-containing protein [Phormidium tenue FACHB-886]